ncbi:MAG: hypothetical protein IT375_15750, partial [Polyangiaceae bacterium]|nr:hypothetical protein [Polyangiaceae bacterium]
PSFILFLTDGLPTVGERNEAKIVENAHQHNDHRTRLINFGVGYDVNSRLLDRLSRENFGQSEFVRPDEDIEAHVSRVYQKFAAPVMTDVAVEVEVDDKSLSRAISRVYPKHVYDLFAGEQLVLVGRYKRGGDAKVTITGKVGGKKEKFDFPAKLIEKSRDQSLAFVEKLWAMRRIGEIIDEIDLKGRNDELVKELVGLSTRHGILTPYTSFLADENSTVRELADASVQLRRARESLGRLSDAEGVAGFSQRAEKFNLQNAQIAPAAPAVVFEGRLQRQVAEPNFDAAAAGRSISAAKRAPSSSAMPGGAAPMQAGGQGQAANTYRDIDSDRLIVASGVQNVGSETLYKRGQTWIANNAKDIDLVKDKSQVQEIKRFSDEYFALVKANTPDENAILAAQQEGEELLVRFRGRAYLIK